MFRMQPCIRWPTAMYALLLLRLDDKESSVTVALLHNESEWLFLEDENELLRVC